MVELNSVIQKATIKISPYFIVSIVTFWLAAALCMQWHLSIISQHSVWSIIVHSYHTQAFLFWCTSFLGSHSLGIHLTMLSWNTKMSESVSGKSLSMWLDYHSSWYFTNIKLPCTLKLLPTIFSNQCGFILHFVQYPWQIQTILGSQLYSNRAGILYFIIQTKNLHIQSVYNNIDPSYTCFGSRLPSPIFKTYWSQFTYSNTY